MVARVYSTPKALYYQQVVTAELDKLRHHCCLVVPSFSTKMQSLPLLSTTALFKLTHSNQLTRDPQKISSIMTCNHATGTTSNHKAIASANSSNPCLKQVTCLHIGNKTSNVNGRQISNNSCFTFPLIQDKVRPTYKVHPSYVQYLSNEMQQLKRYQGSIPIQQRRTGLDLRHD